MERASKNAAGILNLISLKKNVGNYPASKHPRAGRMPRPKWVICRC